MLVYLIGFDLFRNNHFAVPIINLVVLSLLLTIVFIKFDSDYSNYICTY